MGERIRIRASRRVYLEVEVRVPRRVTGVAVERDLLAGEHGGTVGDGVGRAFDAAACVVVARACVVVQVDVHVHRPASAVEVEHAAAEAGDRVVDASRFGRDDRSAPRVLHVDPRVSSVAPRVAVVVPEERLCDEREDDPGNRRTTSLRSVRRRGQARRHEPGKAGESESEEDPRKRHPGCRP